MDSGRHSGTEILNGNHELNGVTLEVAASVVRELLCDVHIGFGLDDVDFHGVDIIAGSRIHLEWKAQVPRTIPERLLHRSSIHTRQHNECVSGSIDYRIEHPDTRDDIEGPRCDLAGQERQPSIG